MMSMMSMKKSLIVCVTLFAMAGSVHAADFATTKTPQVACTNGEKADVPANSKMYMKKGVKVKCSANINVSFIQAQNGVAVGANSTKGTTSYMGSSITGSVIPHRVCPGNCTANDATAAAVAAVPLEAL